MNHSQTKKKKLKFELIMWCWLIFLAVRMTYSSVEAVWVMLYEGIPAGIGLPLWLATIAMLSCYTGALWIMVGLTRKPHWNFHNDYSSQFFFVTLVQMVISIVLLFGYSLDGGLKQLSWYDRVSVVTWILCCIPLIYYTKKTLKEGY